MPLVPALPLRKTTDIRADWKEFSIGELVAFGGRSYAQSFGNPPVEIGWSMVEIRADSEVGPVHVSISPECAAFLGQVPQNATFLDGCRFAAGPAVGVSASYELFVSPLSPKNASHALEHGEVLYHPDSERLFCGLDFPIFGHRGLVLRGGNTWKIEPIPPQGNISLGKIGIRPVTQPLSEGAN